MKPQFITTGAGDRLVVIPETEFDRLIEAVEDAEDSAAVRLFHAKLAAGEEEFVPSEMVDRVLAGENKIRVWREHRGLTVEALAEKAGIAPARLSQIEAGESEGGIETLRKIAGALKLTIDDIV